MAVLAVCGFSLRNTTGIIVSAFASIALCLLAVRSLSIKLVLTDDGVRIQNLFRTTFVPWSEVVRLEVSNRFMPIGVLGVGWPTIRFVTEARSPHVMALELYNERRARRFMEAVRPFAERHEFDLSRLRVSSGRLGGNWRYPGPRQSPPASRRM